MIDKATLERLQTQGRAIADSFSFWEKNISALGEKLNKLCESDEDNYEEIEELQKEIQKWQKRGETEQLILDKYRTESTKLLINNLCSGISTLNLNY